MQKSEFSNNIYIFTYSEKGILQEGCEYGAQINNWIKFFSHIGWSTKTQWLEPLGH